MRQTHAGQALFSLLVALAATAIVFLTGCAPGALTPPKVAGSVNIVQAGADAVQRDPARVLISAGAVTIYNDGAEPMTGDPSRPGDRLSVVITAPGGFKPVIDEPASCNSGFKQGYTLCFVPDIPAGGTVALAAPLGQPVSCTLLYYRPSKGPLLYTKPCKL